MLARPCHFFHRLYDRGLSTTSARGLVRPLAVVTSYLVLDILDRLAERFPPEFYRDLNGGICFLPERVEDPQAPAGEL